MPDSVREKVAGKSEQPRFGRKGERPVFPEHRSHQRGTGVFQQQMEPVSECRESERRKVIEEYIRADRAQPECKTALGIELRESSRIPCETQDLVREQDMKTFFGHEGISGAVASVMMLLPLSGVADNLRATARIVLQIQGELKLQMRAATI